MGVTVAFVGECDVCAVLHFVTSVLPLHCVEASGGQLRFGAVAIDTGISGDVAVVVDGRGASCCVVSCDVLFGDVVVCAEVLAGMDAFI